MSDFTISAFITILTGNLKNNETQELTGIALFSCFTNLVNKEIPITILEAKTISSLVNRKIEVPEIIKKLCDDNKYLLEIKENFTKNVFNNLHSQIKDDVFFRVLTCIKNDSSISVPKKEAFQKYYDNKDYFEFLFQAFLYVNCLPNIKKKEKQINELPFLEEVKNCCPLCHTSLIKNLKNNCSTNFEVVLITNDLSLSEFNENKIALCKKCANEYLSEYTKEKQNVLIKIKTDLLNEQNIQEQILNQQLEEQILEVIEKLQIFDGNYKLEKKRLPTLKIKQKVEPQNFTLINEVENHVTIYYRFIEELFAESNSYKKVKIHISNVFNILELETNGNQKEIYTKIANWIMQKLNLNDKYELSCKIIVSFFIQNCEVFREIAK